MTKADPATPESPRPSVREMQQRLAAELSLSTRVLYTLLLLFDLLIAGVVGSLLLTQPDLPTPIRVAFGGIVLATLAWAILLVWTLARRKILLVKHRLVTSRVAVLSTAAFSLGAVATAFADPDLRKTSLFASVFGVLLLAAALTLWWRASRRYRQLFDRARKLERDLASISG